MECLTSQFPLPAPHTSVSSCHISCAAEEKSHQLSSRMWAKGRVRGAGGGTLSPGPSGQRESRGINGDE